MMMMMMKVLLWRPGMCRSCKYDTSIPYQSIITTQVATACLLADYPRCFRHDLQSHNTGKRAQSHRYKDTLCHHPFLFNRPSSAVSCGTVSQSDRRICCLSFLPGNRFGLVSLVQSVTIESQVFKIHTFVLPCTA